MTQRLHITVRGAVQGVGFRPFIFRLAGSLSLPGWVSNSPQGVFIEVEGEKPALDSFLLRIQKEKPAPASIHSLEYSILDPVGFTTFTIRPSETAGEMTALILPDIATCPDCLREILDPSNRRYRYPFTNCTNCGPRFTIVEAMPYDRPNTSMKAFRMCPDCQSEYADPSNRRFHAQPNACPACGPRIELWDKAGLSMESGYGALERTATLIRQGQIAAIKGLGGFQLVVDARNNEAIRRLRERKHRDEKPLALMFPSLDSIKSECEVSDLEERLLSSPESPIVLLRRHSSRNQAYSAMALSIAPRNPNLGVMLPYTPLHHLLMRVLEFPIVATSGNLSDEPICTEEEEALHRLKGIADVFLVHNRPIVRHADDSVTRVLLGREMVLRRARGYAPLPVYLPIFEKRGTAALLAVGAHLKNSVAVTSGNGQVFISQHIGDLETQQSMESFRKVIHDFKQIFHIQPSAIACDLHPDYLSTRYANESGLKVMGIQHHYAHAVSCMAENGLEGRVLAVAWDGTGLGMDGSIWGGEFLLTDEVSFQRIASFRSFRLPGGDLAIKEPRRSALGLLFELLGSSLFERTDVLPLNDFSAAERSLLQQMLQKGVNSPVTTSVGRLFDAIASILGICQKARFEGQAAMELEFAIEAPGEEVYPFEIIGLESGISKAETNPLQISPVSSQAIWKVDWTPLVEAILRDLGHITIPRIAVKFHNSLVETIVDIAQRTGEERVVLTGGCFQNRYLTERAVHRLTASGFRPYWHQRVPPNDGGISLGQIVGALRFMQKEA